MHGAAGFGEKLRDVVGVGHGGRRAALRAARRPDPPSSKVNNQSYAVTALLTGAAYPRPSFL
jgi:hypothetical protein